MAGNDDTQVMGPEEIEEIRRGSDRRKEIYSPSAAEAMPAYDVILIETPAYESIAIIADEKDICGRPGVYVNGEPDGTLDPLGLADGIMGEKIERENPNPMEVGEKYDVDWSGVADTTRGTLDRLMASVEKDRGRLPLRSRKKKALVIYEKASGTGPWTEGKYTILGGQKGEEYTFVRVRGMTSRQSAEGLANDFHNYVRYKRDQVIMRGTPEELAVISDGSYFMSRKRRREAAERPRAPIPEAQPEQKPAVQRNVRRFTLSEARAKDITMKEMIAGGGGTSAGKDLTEREKELLFEGGVPGQPADDSDRSDSDVIQLGRKRKKGQSFFDSYDRCRPDPELEKKRKEQGGI
jgi:hypothetical protein